MRLGCEVTRNSPSGGCTEPSSRFRVEGMEHSEKQPLLGNGYYLDLVNNHGAIVLCRDDGTEVARFSAWDATSTAIEQAAKADQRRNQKV